MFWLISFLPGCFSFLLAPAAASMAFGFDVLLLMSNGHVRVPTGLFTDQFQVQAGPSDANPII